ncbi:reactive intermediate/imine deaminase [Streptosporangium violaceochromogenes]|nr:reactive intermediate/imine deaminase [Streptosporangium violaceochromogenes]
MIETSGRPSAIRPPHHTLPIGRYSPAVSVPLDGERTLVFISGQVAGDAQGRTLGAGDPARQTEAVFELMSEILKEAGGSLADLVSVVIYLADMAHLAAVSEVRNRVLSEPPPASTLVEVARLAVAGHLVEISGVAVVEAPRNGRAA